MTDDIQPKAASKLRILWKCFLNGLFWTPLCVFAPAGLVQFMGMRPTESPLFIWAAVAFPLAMTAVLYARTHRGAETVEGVVDQLSESLGRGIQSSGRAVGGCLLSLAVLALFLFVGAGIIGLLLFGIRQIV